MKIIFLNCIPVIIYIIYEVFCYPGYDTLFSIMTYIFIEMIVPMYLVGVNSRGQPKRNFFDFLKACVRLFLIMGCYHILTDLAKVMIHMMYNGFNWSSIENYLSSIRWGGIIKLKIRIQFIELLATWLLVFLHTKISEKH